MTIRIGVDVGGSFTDFAALDTTSGQVTTLKVFSRPDDPGAEIMLALDILRDRDGLHADAVTGFAHGTTVGINTVIQRNGEALALFTTRNFEDVLEVARLKIPQIHNLYSRRPAPLIRRECVFGIDERTLASGDILAAPRRDDVKAAVAAARALGCRGVVIAFLHAYRNPANEQAVKAMIAEIAPDMAFVASAETWPIIREYERTITAVISGYVRPRVSHYLDRFEDRLRQRGVDCPLLITKSNGGVMGLDQARAECVQMILSGTASGVIGAGHLARASGFDRVLSLDIGGTSADVAVIIDGEPQYGVGETIGDFHIHIPSVSVSSVGQGGGSVAWVDDLGVLQVGPTSAGSTPGPACYGRGGVAPTITDAMAVQNLIGHLPLGYGAVSVDHAAAHAAFAPLAERLGSPVEAVAADVLAVAVSGMFAEVSGLISRFAIDPRAFHLFAFGGAGPMLACFLARELDLKGIVVPPAPGVVSAFGGLIADLKNDFIATLYREATAEAMEEVAGVFAALVGRARDWLQQQGHEGSGISRLSADMRYAGQSFEIETPIEASWLDSPDVGALRSAFHAEHARVYGHADPEGTVQIVNLRVVIMAPTPKPALVAPDRATGPLQPTLTVPAHFDGRPHAVPVFVRGDIRPGHRLPSPAIIAQDDTTTVIPPGFVTEVDRFGNLVITRDRR